MADTVRVFNRITRRRKRESPSLFVMRQYEKVLPEMTDKELLAFRNWIVSHADAELKRRNSDG